MLCDYLYFLQFADFYFIMFFFFKQKTAYEMRISDWSSDVCSSDLPHFGRAQPMGCGAEIDADSRAGELGADRRNRAAVRRQSRNLGAVPRSGREGQEGGALHHKREAGGTMTEGRL